MTLAACAPEATPPDLAQIYTRVAEEAGQRPLITVPGTLGSRLVDRATGTVIWGGGASRGLSADPDDPDEAALIALPIPGPEVALVDLANSVGPDGILDSAQADVLGIPIDIEVYGGVRRVLRAGGFRPQGGTYDRAPAGPGRDRDAGPKRGIALTPPAAVPEPQVLRDNFGFAYDWRRDLIASVQEFDRFVRAHQQDLADRQGAQTGLRVDPDQITFDLLAHSMGGLIARYYLMYGAVDLPTDGSLPPLTWAGARAFNRVVLVAPPNGGSIIAMDNLVNGKSFGPFQPDYPGALLATHPSVWQLMPRARHGRLRWADGTPGPDPYDPAVWNRFGWGLADPEAGPLLATLMPDLPDPAARAARARAHQARLIARAAQFHRAMDRVATPPEGLELFLVVGGGFETPAAATVEPGTGALTLSAVEEGDGVVLRSSVLLDERPGSTLRGGLRSPLRFGTTLFLPDEHVRLTQNPVFGDNLLFWLLERPRDVAELARPSAGPDLGGAIEAVMGGVPELRDGR